jgi:hypothetical protein
MALAEVNLNLGMLPWYNRPAALLKKWVGPETTTQPAYNWHNQSRSATLWGGTQISTFGQETARLIDSQADPTGLSRWSWQCLRGKNGRVVRLYSCYLPVKSNYPGSVYTQHLIYHQAQSEPDPSPITLFLRDLQISLQQAAKQGDLIILGIDANMDLLGNNTFTRLMRQNNLYNPLSNLPDLGYGDLPPTRTPGSKVIDGIYISDCIPVAACGYWGTKSLPLHTDHACLWVDFKPKILFGHKIPPFVPPMPNAFS